MPGGKITFDDFINDDFKKRLEELNIELGKSIQAFKAVAKEAQAMAKDVKAAKSFDDLNKASGKASASVNKLTDAEKRLERATKELAFQQSDEGKQLAKVNYEKQKAAKANRDLARTQDEGAKKTRGWAKALGSFQFQFNALGNIAANVVSKLTQGIKKFVTGSLAAYDKQIKAERALLVAMEGRAGATERLIRQASALQKITLFGDEETIRAQSLIAAFVDEEEAIKKVIPLVQDLATAKGMDLAGAADLVSKTLGSSTNALSRYGITVEGNVGSTERLDSLVRGLTDAFGGQAQAAAIVDAQFTSLKNTIGDLQEEIGAAISDFIFMMRLRLNLFPDLTQKTIELSKAEKEANEIFKDITDSTKTSLEVTERLNKIRIDQKETDEKYHEELRRLNKTKGKERDAIHASLAAIRDEKDVYESLIPIVELYIGKLQLQETVITDTNKAVKKETKETNEAVVNTANTQVEAIDASLIKFGEFHDGIRKDVIQPLAEEIPEAGEIARKTFSEILDESEKYVRWAEGALRGFTDIFASQKEKELSIVGDNAMRREQIEKKYAKRKKIIAIAQAIIDGARSIQKTKSELGLPAAIPFMIADAAITAIQIGVIASQKFAKGTKHSPEGYAAVGEKGPELRIEPSGEMSLTPGESTLTYLKRGTEIKPADVTKKLLQYTTIANAMEGRASDAMIMAMMNEMKASNEKLRRELKNKPVSSVTITPAGIQTAVHRGNTVLKKVDKYFK